MADIQWIKLSVNMFDDEKIKLIRTMPEGDSIVIVWVQLLCLAGKINDGGLVYLGQNLAYSDEMISTIFNTPLSTVRLALKTLSKFEMIEIDGDGRIDISNWEKHQNIAGMEKIREQNRLRKQAQRERELQLKVIDVTSRDSHATEKNREEKNREEKKEKKPTRHKHGEYGHILLTDEQMEKLVNDFNKTIIDDFIRKVDEYCQQHGKTYKDYNLTIRNWIAKDNGGRNGAIEPRKALKYDLDIETIG